MFWQPFWWHAALRSTYAQNYAQFYSTIGTYCTRAKKLSASAATSCFEGIGYDAPIITNFDAKTTADECATVSAHATERIACWSWASGQLKNNEEREANRFRVCANLTGAEKKFCGDHNAEHVDWDIVMK